MTGAGSATLAFVKEDSFKTLPGTPTYYEPGKDPTISDLTLDRALARQRDPSAVFATESVAENIEGAFAVEFTMDSARQDDVHDIVFNASGPYTLTSGLTASSRWYVGLDYVGGTAERELIGCVATDYTVSYTQGGEIRVSITFIYADEEKQSSITPSSINEATGTSAMFHGMDLTIDGTVQAKEQSAELTLTNMARFERGSDPVAIDAVVGPAQADLTVTAIYTEDDQLELAYGGAGQTSTTKTMSGVSASLDLSAAGASIANHSLDTVKPTTYGWEDVISGDASTTETVGFVVTGEPAVSIS